MGYIVLAIGVLTTCVLALSMDWLSFWPALLTILGCLIYLALRSQGPHRSWDELKRLQDAYDQLDRQAKLVIRTDLELHRAQEELDRRLASLLSLHHFSQQVQVSLRPDEVFRKVDASVVTNFGMLNGLAGLCRSLDAVEWQSLVGISPPVAEQIKQHLMQTGLLKEILTNPAPRVLHAGDASHPAVPRLLELLSVHSVVVAGIMPHTGPAGCLLLGRGGSSISAKADEDLVAILVNQLGTAVENSSLYEEAWAAKRELERKVQERTKELADANAQLLRLNKAKSDFVSAVSHELRTPLAAIKGYASLLGSGQFGPLADAQKERIQKIEKHTDLLTQFITNLLDIAKIEAGRTTMEIRPIPVGEFFATVEELVHPQLQAKQIRYAVELDGVQELIGDAQHLRRVFMNLLSNAIKYTPEGGTIRVAVRRQGELVEATVTDTGHGIGPDDLPKLFQEFYRANDPVNREIRGTGLGLALVKRIVEAHHGHIVVASEKGKGSTFTVTLPAA